MVSPTEPSYYMSLRMPMQKDNEAPLMESLKKFEAPLKEGPNAIFHMSKVCIDHNEKQEFQHTPIKQVVNARGTVFEHQSNTKYTKYIQPEPAMTLCQVKAMKQNCRFDITALVCSMSEPKAINSTRESVVAAWSADSKRAL